MKNKKMFLFAFISIITIDLNAELSLVNYNTSLFAPCSALVTTNTSGTAGPFTIEFHSVVENQALR